MPRIEMYGDLALSGQPLHVHSLIARAGVLCLCNHMSRLEAHSIVFLPGSSLRPSGSCGIVGLCAPDSAGALTFHAGSILDLDTTPLLVEAGRVILRGMLRIGASLNDPFDPTHVSVDDGEGTVVLGEDFRIALHDRLQCAYHMEDDPDPACLVDAVVRHETIRDGELWEQNIITACGCFRLTAKLGLPPAAGGGLILQYTKARSVRT